MTSNPPVTSFVPTATTAKLPPSTAVQFQIEWDGTTARILPTFFRGPCEKQFTVLCVDFPIIVDSEEEVTICVRTKGTSTRVRTFLEYKSSPRMVMNHNKPNIDYRRRLDQPGVYGFAASGSKFYGPIAAETNPGMRFFRELCLPPSRIVRLRSGDSWTPRPFELRGYKRLLLSDGMIEGTTISNATWAVEVLVRQDETAESIRTKRLHSTVIVSFAVVWPGFDLETATLELVPLLFGPGADQQFLQGLRDREAARSWVRSHHTIGGVPECPYAINVDNRHVGLTFTGGTHSDVFRTRSGSARDYCELEAFAHLFYLHGSELVQDSLTLSQQQWLSAHSDLQDACAFVIANYRVVAAWQPSLADAGMILFPKYGDNPKYGRFNGVPAELSQIFDAFNDPAVQHRGCDAKRNRLCAKLIESPHERILLVPQHYAGNSNAHWYHFGTHDLPGCLDPSNSLRLQIAELLQLANCACGGESLYRADQAFEKIDGSRWLVSAFYQHGSPGFPGQNSACFPIRPGERKHFVFMLACQSVFSAKSSWFPQPTTGAFSSDFDAAMVLAVTIDRHLSGQCDISRYEPGTRYRRVFRESIVEEAVPG